MSQTRVSVESLKEFESALKRVSAAVSGRAQAAALTIAADEILVPAAQKKVPRLSGELAESIRTEAISASAANASVAVGTDVFYAGFIEFGTAGHRIEPNGKALRIGDEYRRRAEHPGASPRPFLRPAYDENQQKISERVADELRKRLEQL